jgi:hypothetical protein
MRYLFILLFIFFNKLSYSCSCYPLGKIDEKQYNEYGLIVKGKIVKVIQGDYETEIVIRVITSYKGTLKKKNITILSPKGDAVCGISPKPGEEWLMFAHLDNKKYQTSLCTRTKNMNPKAWNYRKEEIEDDILFLESKLKINGS